MALSFATCASAAIVFFLVRESVPDRFAVFGLMLLGALPALSLAVWQTPWRSSYRVAIVGVVACAATLTAFAAADAIDRDLSLATGFGQTLALTLQGMFLAGGLTWLSRRPR